MEEFMVMPKLSRCFFTFSGAKILTTLKGVFVGAIASGISPPSYKENTLKVYFL
jgi:hypothetical protein